MASITRYADLHCHPHMRSFNWLHNQRKPEIKSKYNPWWIILPKKKSKDKGVRAAAYTQCDMAKITNGNLKLGFISLYPLEKGWVQGREDSTQFVAKNLKKIVGDNKLNEWLSVFLNRILQFIGNDRGGRLAIRDIIQAIYMKIPLRRINFVQSKRYDYFKELKEEREFLLKRNRQVSSTKLFVPFLKRLFVNKKKVMERDAKNLKATGEYVLANNGQNVVDAICENKTAFVLTIEGTNVFNTQEDYNSIKNKIAEVKRWREPVFFITFSHHFYNHLAGHAHSIPDEGNLLLDQSEGMNSGFTEKGLEVLRYLLAIDDNGTYNPEKYGRRILIDVKHLNAKSRKEYFHDYVLPSLDTENPIPVIASHVAYSGVGTIDELIEGMPAEKNGNFSERYGHKFNNWNINLCDEDVVNIYKSKGLIGINLDQRVLGLSKEDEKKNETHANYVWQNIKGMMKAVIHSNDPQIQSKKNIINTFCLGTDFDGLIDPLNKYPTIMDFKQLGEDLIELVKADPEKDSILFGATVELFIQKVCFDNAYDFVVRNFK